VRAPNSALYRDLMGAFRRAKERFTVHLRPEDIQRARPGARSETLTNALARLVEWANSVSRAGATRPHGPGRSHDRRREHRRLRCGALALGWLATVAGPAAAYATAGVLLLVAAALVLHCQAAWLRSSTSDGALPGTALDI
jgi:hypothetical protein